MKSEDTSNRCSLDG